MAEAPQPPSPGGASSGACEGASADGACGDEYTETDHGLTEEQIDEFREAFMLLDKDEDGKITIPELGIVMRSVGLAPTEQEFTNMIKKVGTDSKGTIEFNQFFQIMVKKMKDSDDEEEMRYLFRIFDINNDGFISASKLKQLLNNLGERLSDDEIEEMIRDADMDGDGLINFEDFLAATRPKPPK